MDDSSATRKLPRAIGGFKELTVRSFRIARNALQDLRYGAPLGGLISMYGNTDYLALSNIFAKRIKDNDVLVDVGCGKGRVIQLLARAGAPKSHY